MTADAGGRQECNGGSACQSFHFDNMINRAGRSPGGRYQLWAVGVLGLKRLQQRTAARFSVRTANAAPRLPSLSLRWPHTRARTYCLTSWQVSQIFAMFVSSLQGAPPISGAPWFLGSAITKLTFRIAGFIVCSSPSTPNRSAFPWGKHSCPAFRNPTRTQLRPYLSSLTSRATHSTCVEYRSLPARVVLPKQETGRNSTVHYRNKTIQYAKKGRFF
jgi:hypothetical protein